MIAITHAYKFTHFSSSENNRTTSPEEIGIAEKFLIALTGVSNPRPEISDYPDMPYEKIILNDNYYTACWKIKAQSSKGIIILFHGYSGCKSGLLKQANAFLEMNYSVFLVDFMGCGETRGRITTVGYFEAEQVKSAFDYIYNDGEKNIILYGTSMGATAILRAVSECDVNPEKMILECPFSSLYKTVKNRFEMMGLPAFPMAELIVFWGGFQNGFNGFSHNPAEYSKEIYQPVLLMHGKEDKKVSLEEIHSIYSNLKGKKKLKIFDNTAHENYLVKNEISWKKEAELFLNSR